MADEAWNHFVGTLDADNGLNPRAALTVKRFYGSASPKDPKTSSAVQALVKTIEWPASSGR